MHKKMSVIAKYILSLRMAKEIERKFLVAGDGWRGDADSGTHIVQGYLSTDPDATVRVRMAGGKAFITVKGRNNGAVRDEWEYEIPVADARQMIALCRGIIDKTRYRVPAGNGMCWEIDVYHGRHQGLVTAEIEMPAADTPVTLPCWIEREVTGDVNYYNSTLSQH